MIISDMSFLASKLIRSVRPAGLLSRSVTINSTRSFCVSYPKLDYKAELTAKQINNDNPFDTYVLKPEAGRGLLKNAPILVPSMAESRFATWVWLHPWSIENICICRMVGCCCEDDYKDIVWFELSKGKEQQCDCGNYFKLIDYDPLDPNIKPKYGMGFGSGFGSIYY